jgi:hypothetical protein
LQFLLRLLPIALADQLLDLCHLGRRESHLVTAHLFAFAEQRSPHPVERIAGTCGTDDRAETTDAQHSGGKRCQDRQTPVPTTPGRHRVHSVAQCGGGIAFGDQIGRRGPPDLVAPLPQQGEQLCVTCVNRRDTALGGERIQQLVGAGDGVQRLAARVSEPSGSSEISHGHIPP